MSALAVDSMKGLSYTKVPATEPSHGTHCFRNSCDAERRNRFAQQYNLISYYHEMRINNQSIASGIDHYT